MKKVLVVLALMMLFVGCISTDSIYYKTGYMRQDYWNKYRYNIYDENGFRQGYIQQSYFDKQRFDVYELGD